MSLLKQIAADRLQHRKLSRTNAVSKIAAVTLTTLYGEAAIIGKNDGGRETTDDEVMEVVTKFIKGIRDNQKYRPNTPEELSEIALYNAYVPATISSEVVREFAVQYLSTIPSGEITMRLMGKIMKALNSEYPKQIDGQIAGPIINRLILGK